MSAVGAVHVQVITSGYAVIQEYRFPPFRRFGDPLCNAAVFVECAGEWSSGGQTIFLEATRLRATNARASRAGEIQTNVEGSGVMVHVPGSPLLEPHEVEDTQNLSSTRGKGGEGS
jgi:hypothetical protein